VHNNLTWIRAPCTFSESFISSTLYSLFNWFLWSIYPSHPLVTITISERHTFESYKNTKAIQRRGAVLVLGAVFWSLNNQQMKQQQPHDEKWIKMRFWEWKGAKPEQWFLWGGVWGALRTHACYGADHLVLRSWRCPSRTAASNPRPWGEGNIFRNPQLSWWCWNWSTVSGCECWWLFLLLEEVGLGECWGRKRVVAVSGEMHGMKLKWAFCGVWEWEWKLVLKGFCVPLLESWHGSKNNIMLCCWNLNNCLVGGIL